MARYIDIDKMNKWTKVDHDCCVRQECKSAEYDCNECFYNNGGAEDVAQVVHAEWLPVIYGFKRCSACEESSSCYKGYCPNCGAKMDKE